MYNKTGNQGYNGNKCHDADCHMSFIKRWYVGVDFLLRVGVFITRQHITAQGTSLLVPSDLHLTVVTVFYDSLPPFYLFDDISIEIPFFERYSKNILCISISLNGDEKLTASLSPKLQSIICGLLALFATLNCRM